MSVLKRTCQLSFLIGSMTLMVVSFQNFSVVSVEDLRPEMTAAHAAERDAGLNDQGDQDIRDFAPRRPADFGASTIAVPDSGKDPGSIGLNWLTKQANLSTNGGDQRVLDDMNKRLIRMTKFTPVEGEPWPEPSTNSNDEDGDDKGRAPSSANPAGDGTGNNPAGGGISPEPKPQAAKASPNTFSLAPQSVHFSQLNRFEVKFDSSTQLNCMVGSGGVELDLKRPLSDHMDVGVRHQTATQASTLHLQYSW